MARETTKSLRIVLITLGTLLTITGIVIVTTRVMQKRGSAAMSPAENPSDTGPTIPPIDRNAPAHIETATFALG